MSIPQDEHPGLEQEPDRWVRKAMADPAEAFDRVSNWYLLSCVLPFACAAFVPWLLMPETGGHFGGLAALVGFLLWGFGLSMGAIGGAIRFHPYRKAHLAYAQTWNVLAWLLAVAVLLVGSVGWLVLIAIEAGDWY